MQGLVGQETAVVSVQDRHNQLVSSISQRLKWAAGANPTLQQVLEQFEDSSAERSSVIEVMQSFISTETGIVYKTSSMLLWVYSKNVFQKYLYETSYKKG